jgi:hypothetical protein
MTHIPLSLKNVVRDRAKGFCEYCHAPEIIVLRLEIDHIQPASKGGLTTEDNLCCACSLCNGAKLDFETGIDPETNTAMLLFHPRQQKWHEHFQWNNEFTQIVGLTPVGRATIQRLNLNSDVFIYARQRWRKAGWQPPE